MNSKDKYLLIELGLTAALLITSVFLLKPTVFWQYQLLLICAAAGGFTFAWHNRKWGFDWIKYLTDAAILVTVTWLGFRIFKSTFLYKEVIAILIQALAL